MQAIITHQSKQVEKIASVEVSTDEQTTAQDELNAHIANLAQAVAPEIEIDSDIDSHFGTLYRVWHSYHLLGTFYSSIDGKWIVQSSYTDSQPRCNTAAEAQLLIVAMSGLLVADTATESVDIDQLLDKAFDELTPDEWERLKQYAIRARSSPDRSFCPADFAELMAA